MSTTTNKLFSHVPHGSNVEVVGAFGGGKGHSLPFGSKESVMNIQECVKLDENDKLLTLDRAIKYLEYRAQNREPNIAMTLANKVSCKETAFKPWQRSDGYAKLFISQMKNNDREFDILIDKMRRDIPESDIKKYSKRRTQSQHLKDHEIPP